MNTLLLLHGLLSAIITGSTPICGEKKNTTYDKTKRVEA